MIHMEAHFNAPLPLLSGKSLPSFTLTYETYGTLNPEKSNAILLCHALTRNFHAMATNTDPRPVWWEQAVGPGKISIS